MKPEKMALSVALIASILALIISIFNFLDLPGKTTPKSAPGEGGGGGMRAGGGGGGSYTPSEEYLAKHQEKIDLMMRVVAAAEAKHKDGKMTMEAYLEQRYELDEARIMLLKIKEGRRPFQGFSEAFVKVVMLRELEKDSKKSPEELNIAKIRRLNAEIRLMDAMRRMDGVALTEADKLIKDYSAPLTDEQLQKLIEMEPARGGGRG